MVATSTEVRNYWLDAFAGHPEYSYSFTPTATDVMTVTLTNGGIPGSGGTALTGMQITGVVSDSSVYPDSTDGLTKTYTGGVVTFPAVEGEILPNATHIVFSWGIYGYLFLLDTPIEMLSGRAVSVTLPELTWDPSGVVVVGMTEALRMRFLGQVFGNSESPLGPGDTYNLALFVGDPQDGGVEVDAWDYAPIEVSNNTLNFTGGDPYIVYFRWVENVRFPRCWSDWGTVTHIAWMTNAATPSVVCSGILDDPIDAVAGTLVEIDPDAVTMTFGDLV